MTYNIIYKLRMTPGTDYLFALDENQFAGYIKAYSNGEDDFFFRGENVNIRDTIKVTVYDTSKGSKDFPAKVLYEQLIIKFNETSFHIYDVEATLKTLGIDVTEEVILGSYGYLKKSILKPDKNSTNAIEYVNAVRIKELMQIGTQKYDLTKLIRLCEEINSATHQSNWFSVGALVRAVLDHIPPIFSCKNFNEVVNNYSSPGKTKSFKDSMNHLNESMRKISDSHLHSHVTKSETLPNETQVDCKRDLDRLLEEIVRILQ